MIIDGFWLYEYGRAWWKAFYVADDSLEWLRTTTVVSTVLLVLNRIILIILLFKVGNIKLAQPKVFERGGYNLGMKDDKYFVPAEFSLDDSDHNDHVKLPQSGFPFED